MIQMVSQMVVMGDHEILWILFTASTPIHKILDRALRIKSLMTLRDLFFAH